MEFGRKVQVGNFTVMKFARAMRKKELAQSRRELGLPEDIWKHLTRSGVPFVKVSANGGIWNMEFGVGMVMFAFIENAVDTGQTEALEKIFTMIYGDSSIVGDNIYWNDKQESLKRFVERRAEEMKEDGEEEDLAVVKSIVDLEEMGEEISKEGGEK